VPQLEPRQIASPPADGATGEKSPGRSHWILWGLVLGLASGLLLGEYCRPLLLVGEAYVKLLQMTVMPYILVSLILGIGGLTRGQARELVRKAGALMLVFWSIALVTVVLMPLSFPHWQTAAFFSSSLVEQPPEKDWLDLYIPSNPFRSLADNVVPAVVLFSILAGVALLTVQEKSRLLPGLAIAREALSRVTNLIVQLTPLGLFAIVASASGTMSVEEFGRLHVFLLAYVVAALFLAFWVLPGLLTMATPFGYRELTRLSRDALITAFVTGNLLVVLPVLTSRAKELFRQRDLLRDTTEAYVDVIVPVSFNFPNVGKLLLLLFVLFAAWFAGSPISAGQYPTLVLTGLLSFFGSTNVAIPYLLDLLKLPHSLFQLYLISGLVTGRFGSLLAAMNLLIFTVLSVAMLTGVASVRRARLLPYLGLTALVAVALIGGLRLYFGYFVRNTYTMAEVVGRMHLLRDAAPARVHPSVPPAPPHTPGKSRLHEIHERGFVRMGYLQDRLPYAFENARGQLVGFDIEMAHDLARTLGVALEFVLIDRERLAAQVNAGDCDVLMSGITITPERAAQMALTAPYRDDTLAFVVPSHRRKEFRMRAAIAEQTGLRLGFLSDPYYTARLRGALPLAELVELASPREFFEGARPGLDAFVFTAEAGSAWTLLYPRFAVVVPQPGLLSLPLTYAAARGDQELLDFVNAWIALKQKDGTTERLYEYWILGRGAAKPEPRWSVIRDVLHWVK
jgi:Na+/H+-dicarboxylate symporter/ABC-type amino acid transport substrate-binding protein